MATGSETVRATSVTTTPPIVDPTTGTRSRIATNNPSSTGYGMPNASIHRNVPSPAITDVITLPST
jgi:hypothetical protein